MGDGEAADIEFNISSARSDSVGLGGRCGDGVRVGGSGEGERSFLGDGGIIERLGASSTIGFIASLSGSFPAGEVVSATSGSDGGVRDIDFEARLVNSGEGSSVSLAETEDHSSSSAVTESSCCCGTSKDRRFWNVKLCRGRVLRVLGFRTAAISDLMFSIMRLYSSTDAL